MTVDYLVILTLEMPGYKHLTLTRTVSVQSGQTRADLLKWMIGQAPAEIRTGNVAFFHAEPNLLLAPQGTGPRTVSGAVTS